MSTSAPSTIYVGTYTRRESFVDGKAEGIYALRFDPESGRLSRLATIEGEGTINPSYLALAPDQRTLYAVNEITGEHGAHGTLSAFRVGPEGELSLLNQRSSRGLSPCFVSVTPTGRHVLVANYETGNVAVLPTDPDGSLREASDVVQHSGSGPDPERQEGPHAHMVVPARGAELVLAVDLGADQVLAYRLDEESGRLLPRPDSSVVLGAGSGPRHIAMHPERPFAHVIGELDSTVTTLRHRSPEDGVELGSVISTLPAGEGGPNLGAEIQISPSGRHLYATNRGHESIVHYRVEEETGELTLVGHTACRGRSPRYFALDPSGRWMLVANQDSDSVVVFPLDPESGEPGAPTHVADVPTPVCLAFLDPSS